MASFIFVIATLCAVVGSTVFGGWISGLLLGHLIPRSSSFMRSLRRVCRVALWIPLLLWWSLPISFQKSYTMNPEIWAIVFGIVAVMVCVLYHFLLGCTPPSADTESASIYALRSAIVHGLLVSLIIHFSFYSKYWFSITPQSQIAQYGYLAAAIVASLVAIIDRLISPHIEATATINRELFLHDLKTPEQGDLLERIVIGSVLGITIVLMFVIINNDELVGVVNLLVQLKDLLLGAPILKELDDSAWRHLGVSMFTILLGIVISGGVAMLADRLCRQMLNGQAGIFRVFGLTHVLIILVPCFLLGYRGSTSNRWFSILLVVSILFFPFLETFTMFRESTWFSKVLLSLDKNLGYAFVGMLLGESIQASHGVGLAMTIASATQQFVNGFAIAVIVVAIFVLLNVFIRYLLRRIYIVTNTVVVRPSD